MIGVNKSRRMETFLGTLGASQRSGEQAFDRCYLGYFECFNAQRYYEAHDVLEHLWLRDGRESGDYSYYKGLIQLAGAFVHLKLQHAHPLHPKHGKRLHPARRLFLLATGNIAPYGLSHHGLDLGIPLMIANSMARSLVEGDFTSNPWSPESAPLLPVPVTE